MSECLVMKQERSAYLVLSALCNVAVEKQEGERFPLTFLQRYSVKIGYYSLFRYLGSLPRSKVGMSLLLEGH